MQGTWHCPICFQKLSSRLQRNMLNLSSRLWQIINTLLSTSLMTHVSQVHVPCYTNKCPNQYPVCSLISYDQKGGEDFSASTYRGGQISARLIEGGLNFSACNFDKRANLPPSINFDRSLKSRFQI